jgi:hypothetical protein
MADGRELGSSRCFYMSVHGYLLLAEFRQFKGKEMFLLQVTFNSINHINKMSVFETDNCAMRRSGLELNICTNEDGYVQASAAFLPVTGGQEDGLAIEPVRM